MFVVEAGKKLLGVIYGLGLGVWYNYRVGGGN